MSDEKPNTPPPADPPGAANQPAAPKAKTVEVRVLVDYDGGGLRLKCNTVATLDAATAKDLAKAGIVDPAPEAIAAAKADAALQ